MCIESFFMALSVLISLPVPRPALVVGSSHQGDVEQGSSVTLTCNATLFSTLASVQLMWGTPRVISEDEASRFKTATTDSGLRTKLTISDVRTEDKGVYVCTLKGLDNGHEVTANRSITLSVGKLSIT